MSFAITTDAQRLELTIGPFVGGSGNQLSHQAPEYSAASALTMLSSWAGAYYVQEVAHFGATYGSISGVVIFLIWLSWNVNAIFFGGAFATEVELAREEAPVIRRPRISRSRS